MPANFPSWVSTTEKQNLYAQAEALGASLAVLSSEIATQAFVNIKLSTGKIYLILIIVQLILNFVLYICFEIINIWFY
jgi:hypothetical protein